MLRVKRPSKTRELLENNFFHENTIVIGFLDPFKEDNHVAMWQASGITTFSLDLLKLPIDDPRNAQAAMSRIAGRLAFKDALRCYKGDKPIKVTVIETGPAAFSAAFEAKKHDMPVQLFGRKEHYRAELESAGIVYHVLPDESSQARYIQSYLSKETIVIPAARTPGKKAPLLIDEDGLSTLPERAVVIDLAVAEGGNVIGSKHDHIVNLPNGILIVNVSGYPKAEPREASEEFAKCVVNLLENILSPSYEILFDHEILNDSWVTHRRHNLSLYEGFEEFKKPRLKL